MLLSLARKLFWLIWLTLTGLTLCYSLLATSAELQSYGDNKEAAAGPQVATPMVSAPDSLTERMTLWRKQVVYCDVYGAIVPSQPGAFPTKEWPEAEKRKAVPESCNDGDMLLFNGMLCAVGEDAGCAAVRNAFDEESSQWWRTPAILKRHVENPEEPNLNSDQVQGLLLYILEYHDSTRFRRWLEWVRNMGMPRRFCSLPADSQSKCVSKGDDCALILLVAITVGEQPAGLSICSPTDLIGFVLPYKLLPNPDDVFKLYDDAHAAYNRNINALMDLNEKLGIDVLPPIPLPPAPDFANTRKQAKKVVDSIQNLQNLFTPGAPGSQAAAYALASAVVIANAKVAGIKVPKVYEPEEGAQASARHLAGTAILILQKYGVANSPLAAAASDLYKQETDNAFFWFMANGRSAKLDNLIRAACPFDPDSKEPRYQWSWERANSVQAGQQSMYWDCIFAADLALNGLAPAGSVTQGAFNDLLPPILRDFHNAQEALDNLKSAFRAITDAKGKIEDLSKDIREHIANLEKIPPAAAAAAKKYVPNVEGDKVTIPPPGPGTIAPTIQVSPDRVEATTPHIGPVPSQTFSVPLPWKPPVTLSVPKLW
jgi:hypothetical protein